MKHEGIGEIQVSVCHSYMVHWNSPTVYRVFFQVISWHMLTHFSKLEALLRVIEKDLLNFLSTLRKVTGHSGKVSQASLFAWLARVRSVSVTLWTQWSCLTRGSRQTRMPLVGGQMKDTPENSVSNVHIRLKSFKDLLRLNYVQVKSLLCLQFNNFKGEKHK